jgi:hypothetical protein
MSSQRVPWRGFLQKPATSAFSPLPQTLEVSPDSSREEWVEKSSGKRHPFFVFRGMEVPALGQKIFIAVASLKDEQLCPLPLMMSKTNTPCHHHKTFSRKALSRQSAPEF